MALKTTIDNIDASLYKHILENSRVGIAVLSSIVSPENQIIDFQYLFVNKLGRKILQQDQAAGKTLLQTFPEHLENGLFERYVKVIESQRPITFEFYYGESFNTWVSITAIPIPGGLSVSFQDINNRKEEELSVNQKVENLRAFIENLPGGAVHRLGKTVTINKKIEEMLGYSQEAFTDIDTWFKVVHREHYKVARETYEAGRAEGFPGIGELPVFTQSGQMKWMRFTGRIYEQGEVWLLQDITERKEHERKLKEYSEKLEQKVAERTKNLKAAHQELAKALEAEKELSEMKSSFVSMASHEFRTPLATILTSINLIDKYHDPSLQEKRMRHIKRIRSNVQNMRNILDDFLSLSKLEEGKIKANSKAINLQEFFKEYIEEQQDQTKPSQAIIYKHSGEETLVKLDEQLLFNICNNLISNAIKYSPDGKDIYLNSHILENQIKIEVIDQGMGIPEEEQKHLFTRFFRSKQVANIQGTGLGLTIVQRYVALMGGKISFCSKVNRGTTFTICLPLKQN